MPGNTTAIDAAVLRVQWDSYMPMAAICTHWTITKDQLIGVRDAWCLPKRHDRSRRYKPPRAPKPDAAEIEASESSLSLAPLIAARVTVVQATWTVDQWSQRAVHQGTPFGFGRMDPEEMIRRFSRDGDAP